MGEIMNIQALLELFIFFMVTLFLNKLNKLTRKNYRDIIFIIFLICTNISIPFQCKDTYSDNMVNIYIRLSLYCLLLLCFFNINRRTLKIKLDELMIILILINVILQFANGKIFNLSKSVELIVLYLSILLIGILFKSLHNINDFKVLRAFNYVAIGNFILAVCQFITGKMLLPGAFDKSISYGSGIAAVKRVGGFAVSNNGAGNLSAILFSVVLFNYLKNKDKLSLVALISTCIFSALTLTRIGYLAIIIEIIIYFLISRWNTVKQIKNKLIKLMFSSIVIIMGVIIFGQKIYETLFLKRGNTTQWRTIQFNRVFERIVPNNSIWDGIGTGQYTYYAGNILNYRDIDIHSQYINILGENGMMMFIAFCIMNIIIMYKAFKGTNSILEKAFIIGLFVGNIICSNYNPNQYYLINNYFYYILMYLFIYRKKSFDRENLKI